MIIRKAYKFQLKSTPDLETQFLEQSGCTRFAWNKVWAMNQWRLENKLPLLWYREMDWFVKLWKKSEDYSFLKHAHSQVLQQCLKDLEKAMRDGFDKTQPGKRIPKFKKKGLHDSFRYPQGFKIENNRVFLPKIGWVRFFKSRDVEGKPKNVTVSRKGTRWYVSIQVELDRDAPVHPSKSIVGVDLGVNRFATLSNGHYFEPTNSFRSLESKLEKYQRKLAGMEKFSNNWKKQKKKIARLHSRIADARQDRIHWVTNRISKNHAIVVMEDLKVKNMSASAKGTVEKPGKQVKQKAGLNKSILDQGWGCFKQYLEYKQQWRGGEVLFVSPRHTSQTCPRCQHVSKDNRITQSEFKCVECRFQEHADVVGAINVLARGHRVLACQVNGAVMPSAAGTRRCGDTPEPDRIAV